MVSRCVLLVEDEKPIADTIVFALGTEGYTAHHVALGHQALTWLASQPPQACCAIVLDIGLPDINGFDLCREIRRFSDVPILFLTARSEEIDRIVGLEIGADDYVSKPFSPRELVTRIRTILRRVERGNGLPDTKPPSETDFELNEAQASIRFKAHPLVLTRSEYLLLRILVKHPGVVMSRAQLLDHLGESATESGERAIDTHIKVLRSKLRQVDGRECIHTHRGLGYSLHTGPA